MGWKIGSKDIETVKKIQQKLNEKGFGPITVDGIFGKGTESAVKNFQSFKQQSDNDFNVDGIVGPNTYDALFSVEGNEKKEEKEEERELKETNVNNTKDIMDVDGDGIDDFTEEGINLILEYEVGGGEAYYKRYLIHPTWPGYQSGVTIGIGFDIGYNTRDSFDHDWAKLDQSVRERLYVALGVTGASAKRFIAGLKDISVPWDLAYEVFIKTTLPKWYGLTKKAFPGVENLDPKAKSALVSLVFNRGSLVDGTDRRKEMKKIRDVCIPNNDYQCIANQLRSMKRLWQGAGVDGLLRRREAEARLVEKCIG